MKMVNKILDLLAIVATGFLCAALLDFIYLAIMGAVITPFVNHLERIIPPWTMVPVFFISWPVFSIIIYGFMQKKQ